MEIEIPVEVNQEVIAKVHVDDIIEKMNELPMATRFNCIGKILNELETSRDQLTESHIDVITNYLKKQLALFESKSK